MVELPSFEELPPVPSQPAGCTWGLWGNTDQHGTLNLLTADVVLDATKEVKLGRSVSLDLRLDHFKQRIGTRRAFSQEVLDLKPTRGVYVHDDELHFNTQASSQWDGLTHCATQKDGFYYNGLKHEDVKGKREGTNGTQNWVERGGIVGRGVLLDYPLWRERQGQPQADPVSSHAISIRELEAVAASQNVRIKPGDIILLRTGYTEWYDQASDDDRARLIKAGAFMGVEASMDAVRWLWNSHVAAVATDAPGFEVCPVAFGHPTKVVLHEWILVHFGMPLGELWNLEGLARLCRDQGRWSFLLTSAPLHVFGGVASPPNALAIL